MRRSRRPLAALLLLLTLGCGRGPATAAARPERVVALAPSSVELLFALGLGGRVVGVGSYCKEPPEVARLPALGGMMDPNLEQIVTLTPDLAVLLPSEKRLAEHLQLLGIEALTVESDTLGQVEEAVATLARRFDVEERGRDFLREFRRGLAPLDPPLHGRVLLSLEREPGRIAEILSAAPSSFLGDLLTRLGAENVAQAAASSFPRLPLEAILTAEPEVILELRADEPSPAARAALLADWQRFPTLPAVRAGRIAIVAGSHTLVPGPRLPALYRDLQHALRAAWSEGHP